MILACNITDFIKYNYLCGESVIKARICFLFSITLSLILSNKYNIFCQDTRVNIRKRVCGKKRYIRQCYEFSKNKVNKRRALKIFMGSPQESMWHITKFNGREQSSRSYATHVNTYNPFFSEQFKLVHRLNRVRTYRDGINFSAQV